MSSALRFFALLCAAGLLNAAESPSPPHPETVPVPPGAALPQWPHVAGFAPEPGCAEVRSKDLSIIQAKSAQEGFLVQISHRTIGVGTAPLAIGYVLGGQLRWFMPTQAGPTNQTITTNAEAMVVSFECSDPDGAVWSIRRQFRPDQRGAIDIQTELSVNQDRAVAFVPMLLLFPGVGSFGTAKGQGLFAGLEYLDNEPSSSQADVIGPASNRRVPDSLKITFPLMAIQADHHYVALAWRMRPHLSALFDSPDRCLNSGGHLLGLLFPGSNGQERQEGDLLPRRTELVRAGRRITAQATLFGGAGESVVPAVEQFCRLRPVPPVPAAPGLSDYVAQATGGWLDSKIREGSLVRHALAGAAFKPQPAADAAMWMEWLAGRQPQQAEAARLRQASTNLLAAVASGDLNFAGVGHIRYPVESLVFGHVAENAARAEQRGKELLSRFEPDGSVRYHPTANGPDYGKTHFTNEASGLTSQVVAELLETAAFSGNRELIAQALTRLRAMDKFHGGVPRGAQTWECPLHTPDILAAAHLVRAYTLGYELSGEPHFLEEARYWAWTGVPFIYLVNPTEQPVGLYSTIAVFGATNWRAPVWFGLPVQWCGLVYADALYRLARHDPKGVWKHLADGITISGLQQSWPSTDTQFEGLLPDSLALRQQKRNGPAINPATVAACASRFFGPGPAYDFWCFRSNHLLVHAPGQVKNPRESSGQVNFTVQSWVDHSYFILIDGLQRAPQLKINGQKVESSSPNQFLAQEGRLVLQLQKGVSAVDLRL